MNFLCFDISSGGISTALLDTKLEPKRAADNQWILETDSHGAAALTAEGVVDQFKQSIRVLNLTDEDRIDAICIGTFLHSCVLLDEGDVPLTPVFTWLDRRGEAGVNDIRGSLGDRFHKITGCRYHPMFPVFKLAALRSGDPELFDRARRALSIKAMLLHQLTGTWIEDHGVASASGLFDINRATWSAEVLSVVGLAANCLPDIAHRTDIVGRVTSKAASDFGLRDGVPVIAGSGDGFLANLGSDCDVPSKFAITLGTSAVVRQAQPRAVLDLDAGTFCYRADEREYLLGCAGSNGGNVLDWGREVLVATGARDDSADLPIFIPLLHGERSPDWNPNLKGSWHGLTSRHTGTDLSRSILEGVIFNLVHFTEIVQRASGEAPTDFVLSGNGFLHPLAAPTLAGVAGISTWMPRVPGLASMRGAGVCALRALGLAVPALDVQRVVPLADDRLLQRYQRYRRLRAAVG